MRKRKPLLQEPHQAPSPCPILVRQSTNFRYSCPPGVAGLQPQLDLSYSSRRGNGLFGVGWGLSGLSVITRCPKTMAQDGARGVVGDSAGDRFCLDGQRLMLESGSYGAVGALYRTERDSFSTGRAYYSSSFPSGPTRFVVKTKAGQTIDYGNTADSRILTLGGTQVRAWAINRVSDKQNNYSTYSYVASNSNGEHYLSRIDYTGNTATGRTPASAVQFVTEARPDAPARYHAGSTIKTAVRVKTIQTFTDGVAHREYRFSYAIGGATARSTLTQLQECVGPVCLPAVVLASSDAAREFAAYATWSTGHSSADKVGDFNGDGKTDVIQVDASGNARVWLSTGAGFLPATVWATGIGQTYQIADFNGDGKADIVQLNAASQPVVSISSGTSFSAATVWSTSNLAGYQIGDFDGDGKADLFRVQSGIGTVWLSTGSTFASAATWYSGMSTTATYQVGDFDGDGRTDVYSKQFPDSAYVWLSGGTSFSRYTFSLGTTFTGTSTLGDFNGDGKTDLTFMNPERRPER